MNIREFDYELPGDLIAQTPPQKRDSSRMLAADRASGSLRDLSFSDFPSLVREGDFLVVNNTKVFPARLIGKSESGAAVELFLVEELADRRWEALARPAKRLKPCKKIDFGGVLFADIIEKRNGGAVVAVFSCDGDFHAALDAVGKTPLPPYIKRDRSDPDADREKYQTVYAKERGAIAAPTAGFHFTAGILDEIRERGADVAEITLHVGYGTFEPVRVDDVAGHRVQPERFEIGERAAALLNKAKKEGRRIIAVGTTTTRALETSMVKFGEIREGRHIADLTILPGYEFKAVDALLTNFHLPMSSLLVLVSTFGGHQFIMRAYEHAVRERYRFYSYGDCMFVY